MFPTQRKPQQTKKTHNSLTSSTSRLSEYRSSTKHEEILQLQKTIGNRAVIQMLHQQENNHLIESPGQKIQAIQRKESSPVQAIRWIKKKLLGKGKKADKDHDAPLLAKLGKLIKRLFSK